MSGYSNPRPPKSTGSSHPPPPGTSNPRPWQNASNSLSQDDFRHLLMTPRMVSKPSSKGQKSHQYTTASVALPVAPESFKESQTPSLLTSHPSSDLTSFAPPDVSLDNPDWMTQMRQQVLQRKEEALRQRTSQHPSDGPPPSMPEMRPPSTPTHPSPPVQETPTVPPVTSAPTFKTALAKALYTLCIDHHGHRPPSSTHPSDPSAAFQPGRTLLVYRLADPATAFLLPATASQRHHNTASSHTPQQPSLTRGDREHFVIQHVAKFFKTLSQQRTNAAHLKQVLHERSLAAAAALQQQKATESHASVIPTDSHNKEEEEDDIFQGLARYVAAPPRSLPSMFPVNDSLPPITVDSLNTHTDTVRAATDLLDSVLPRASTQPHDMQQQHDDALLLSLRDSTRALRASLTEEQPLSKRQRQAAPSSAQRKADAKTTAQLAQVTHLLDTKYGMKLHPK